MALNALDFEERPWGNFQILHELRAEGVSEKEQDVVVKKLTIRPGKRISYQSHKFRSEHWFVVQGKGLAILDGVEHKLEPGDSLDVALGVKHRMVNLSTDMDFVWVEVSRGHFDENDNVRHEDDYGRVLKMNQDS